MKRHSERSEILKPADEQSDAHAIIAAIRRSWQNFEFLATGLFAVSIALPLMIFLFVAFGLPLWWLIPATAIGYMLLSLTLNRKRIREEDAARLLNRQYPTLEESTELILKPARELGFLERLQVKKVSGALTEIASRDNKLRNTNPGFTKTRKATTLFVLSLIVAFGIYLTGPYLRPATPAESMTTANGVQEKPEKILPAITGITVMIDPPAYTGRENRSQQRLNIRAEEGSKLTWELKTKGNPSSVQLIFNDSSTVELESLNKAPGLWATEKRISTNGFYR